MTVGISFFVTLWILDIYSPKYDIYSPKYDVAALPLVVFGQNIEFTNGQNTGALISGWSTPEAWGVWSDGTEAQLGFIVDRVQGRKVTLYIECNALIAAPKIPEQKIEFWYDKSMIHDFRLVDPVNKLSIPLGSNVRERSPLVMTLKLPSAKSPNDLQLSPDTRKMAIGLLRVRFDS
jgi:hypothetical protein